MREQLLSLAQRQQDPAFLLHAHLGLGPACSGGELAAARMHLEEGMRLYDPQRLHPCRALPGMTPGCVAAGSRALALWFLGYPDQAVQQQPGGARPSSAARPSLESVFALAQGAMLHDFRREAEAVRGHAEAVLALARDQGFQRWEAWRNTSAGLGAGREWAGRRGSHRSPGSGRLRAARAEARTARLSWRCSPRRPRRWANQGRA